MPPIPSRTYAIVTPLRTSAVRVRNTAVAGAVVGIGTVYRHFPTKEALFEAIFRAWVQRLVDEAKGRLSADDPGAAFFDELGSWVEHSIAHRVVAEGLAETGVDVKAATADLK